VGNAITVTYILMRDILSRSGSLVARLEIMIREGYYARNNNVKLNQNGAAT
jgi:hypothetical protein